MILTIESLRGRSLGFRELGSTLSRQDGTIVVYRNSQNSAVISIGMLGMEVLMQ